MENTERLLSVWIEDQNQRNTRGNMVLVQEKTAACSRSSGGSRARAPSRRPSGLPGPVQGVQRGGDPALLEAAAGWDGAFRPEERPGFTAPQDLLTLLLGSNVAGSLKLKPLLVYPVENLRALRGFSKPSLPLLGSPTRRRGSR
ncbi:tigger transposable element-derived protein 1-like [Sus scrofa]|uniref:tigger transposable element-derived protein 1-like n=1 Tax=Sus scrofa TaxID=9823 RepID=UPI000A2AF9F2|nr:tigger transposable element-derived protein 1-like [Sus scrofa]